MDGSECRAGQRRRIEEGTMEAERVEANLGVVPKLELNK